MTFSAEFLALNKKMAYDERYLWEQAQPSLRDSLFFGATFQR